MGEGRDSYNRSTAKFASFEKAGQNTLVVAPLVTTKTAQAAAPMMKILIKGIAAS